MIEKREAIEYVEAVLSDIDMLRDGMKFDKHCFEAMTNILTDVLDYLYQTEGERV